MFYIVKQLHREFMRAGSDVVQTFTFYANEDTMSYKAKAKDNNNAEVENCEVIEVSVDWTLNFDYRLKNTQTIVK